MSKISFKYWAFADAIIKARGIKSYRELAAEIKVSPATLCRLEAANTPDLITFFRICEWLGVSTETFIQKNK